MKLLDMIGNVSNDQCRHKNKKKNSKRSCKGLEMQRANFPFTLTFLNFPNANFPNFPHETDWAP